MPADDPEPPPLAALELLLEVDEDAAEPRPGEEGACWLPDAAFLLDWARHALSATLADGAGASSARHELSVRLVASSTMRALNRDWRGRDAPTNVLSFPAELPPLLPIDADDADDGADPSVEGDGVRDVGADGAEDGGADADGPASSALLALGDLALCPAVIDAEARSQGKPPSAHWAHLVVHGVLHLRGFDHEDGPAAEAMESLEIRLLSMRQIPDPYRAHTPLT